MEFQNKELDDSSSSHVIDLPPHWLARVSDVQHDIAKIESKSMCSYYCKYSRVFLIYKIYLVQDLSELHKKHLLPGFDDKIDEEHAVEIVTADITKV